MTIRAIDIQGLSVHYKTDKRQRINAVTALNLSVDPGEVVGFIGPNGAGKTTTIKVLMGFRFPSEGTAQIFGLSAGSMEARRRIGYLPEVAQYYPFLTARETLSLYAKLTEIPKSDQEEVVTSLIERVRLSGRDREPLRNFSKGMLQRVGIAQAIMGNPDLLILDEVTSGLDPVARLHVRNILLDFKRQGKTVFFSSHELSEVTTLCDRVIMIDNGQVVRQRAMADLRAEMIRFTILANANPFDAELPTGIALHETSNGTTRFSTSDKGACERLVAQLRDRGVSIEGVETDAGSLEDYFVETIGHKVT